jgi:hypothetical protein
MAERLTIRSSLGGIAGLLTSAAECQASLRHLDLDFDASDCIHLYSPETDLAEMETKSIVRFVKSIAKRLQTLTLTASGTSGLQFATLYHELAGVFQHLTSLTMHVPAPKLGEEVPFTKFVEENSSKLLHLSIPAHQMPEWNANHSSAGNLDNLRTLTILPAQHWSDNIIPSSTLAKERRAAIIRHFMNRSSSLTTLSLEECFLSFEDLAELFQILPSPSTSLILSTQEGKSSLLSGAHPTNPPLVYPSSLQRLCLKLLSFTPQLVTLLSTRMPSLASLEVTCKSILCDTYPGDAYCLHCHGIVVGGAGIPLYPDVFEDYLCKGSGRNALGRWELGSLVVRCEKNYLVETEQRWTRMLKRLIPRLEEVAVEKIESDRFAPTGHSFT